MEALEIVESYSDAWVVLNNKNAQTYYVRYRNGKWICSCRYCLFTGKECSHILKVKEYLGSSSLQLK